MYQPFSEGNEPHWDDLLRFNHTSNGHLRTATRDQSIFGDTIEDETTPLIGRIITPSRSSVVRWTSSFWRRALVLNVAPVLFVASWCAVPMPYTDIVDPPDPDLASSSYAFSVFSNGSFNIPKSDARVDLNFWFFLFFYYGIYNAVALLFITKLFSIYALNWWPSVLGGKLSYLIFWTLAETIGAGIYFNPWFPQLKLFNLTWVFVTFLTMAMPVLIAWLVLRSQNRNNYRHSLTEVQKALLSQEFRRTPASYLRFLWFSAALLLALFALLAGEAFTTIFLNTLPHGPIEAFVSVYTWIATIYTLDAAADWIIENKIYSFPLSSIFKLYFMTIYFIFYRNLFARLRSIDQFILVQLGSSLWVCIFFPLCMNSKIYSFLVSWFGLSSSYEDYKRKIGRSFYIRNIAENTTMLGFLLWSTILHFGPNQKAYPYFQFDNIIEDPHYQYTFELTFFAALGIWVTELISAWVTRQVFKFVFGHSITREAVKDYERYPEMVVVFFLVLVHVMQDMLLALLKLNFQ